MVLIFTLLSPFFSEPLLAIKIHSQQKICFASIKHSVTQKFRVPYDSKKRLKSSNKIIETV